MILRNEKDEYTAKGMYMCLVDADLVHENRRRFGKARKISILERFRMSIDWALVLGLYYPLLSFLQKKKTSPALSQLLPYYPDGSHSSAELLMRFRVEPVTLRNLDVPDWRNACTARIPRPRDLEQLVPGYVATVLHAEGL